MAEFKSTLLAFARDERDYIYVPTISSFPSVVDLRGYADYVESQAQIGSCTANAVVSACELILTANNQFINLSRLFNYYESRIHGGIFPADGGAFLRDAITAAHTLGLPSESTWPYVEAELNTTPSTEAYTEALANKIDRYERIYDGFNYDWVNYTYTGTSTIGSAQYISDIKSALCEGTPVVIGLDLTEQFQDIKGNFEYQSTNPYVGVTAENPSIGGHAVVIIGYDDNYNGFIIENSWGSYWGYGGFGILPYATLFGIQQAWVIRGFKGLKVPDPLSTTDPTDTTTPVSDPRYLIPVLPDVPTDPVFFFNGAYQMAITSTDLVWRKSALVSNVAAQNGGVMNYSAVVTTNIKNNLFPDVSQVERTSGSVVFRKLFLHINKNSQDEMLNAYISLGAVTPAEDFVVFYAGSGTDTEASMIITRPYGAGLLVGDVGAGATTLVVDPENITWATANTPIRTGDLICITDGTTTDYVTASSVITDTEITITCSATTHAFTTGALVASVLQVPSTKAAFIEPSITSAAGTFTSTGNLVVNDKGTPDQTWTATFTNSNTYTLTGSTIGIVGVGSIASDFAPSNTPVSAPYLTIKSTGFGGTFTAGDEMIFATTSGTVPIWLSRVVPAGTADVSNNFCQLNVAAESY